MLLERVHAVSQAAGELRPSRLRGRLVAPGPVAIALIVVLICGYFILQDIQWNADSHLYLTVSIVDRGTLNIDPFAGYTGDKAKAQGHYYTDKEPGLSLIAVPFYLVIKLTLLHGRPFGIAHDPLEGTDMWVRYLLAVALSAAPTGVVTALLYKLLQRLGASRGWCAALSLTYGLGTIARPFGSILFSHQFATLLCFGAFFVLFGLRRRELDDRLAVVAGLLAGYALITELPTAIIALALALYAVTIPGVGRRLGALYALGMLPPLALGALYHVIAFGSPLGLGYSHLAGPAYYRQGQSQGLFGVTWPHLDAVWGTTFSPYRGLFFLSPVLLLAIPGCVVLAQRVGWRAEALLCAAVGAAYLLFNWSYFAWNGGNSMGPRQLLPSLPFLVLPIGALVAPGQSQQLARRWHLATGALAAYSIALVELCAAVTPAFDERLISPVTQYVLPQLAGLRVDVGHPWSAQAQLGPALLQSAPLFLTAKLEYNWGQLPDWPGLTQLSPLALVVALLLLWGTLRVQVVLPRPLGAAVPRLAVRKLMDLRPVAGRTVMRRGYDRVRRGYDRVRQGATGCSSRAKVRGTIPKAHPSRATRRVHFPRAIARTSAAPPAQHRPLSVFVLSFTRRRVPPMVSTSQRTSLRTLPAFRNEPLTDFANPDTVRAQEAALRQVESELGQIFPLIIDGERVSNQETFASVNPAHPDQVVARFARADAADAGRAVEAAWKRFQTWQYASAEERAGYLFAAAKRMRERRFYFNALMIYEVGKSWVEADADTAEAIDFLEFYGREALRISGEQPVVPNPGEHTYLTYLPLGVGAVIPPWNFAAAIMVGLTSSALVAGNTVVLKPASASALVAARFVELLEEVGVPKGVVSFLPGPGGVVGDALVTHPLTRFISFTGSREVGLRINELAAKHQPGQRWIKRAILEMGGKDAIIVDETADLDVAANSIVTSAYGFQGQKCSACSRAILVESVYDAVLEKVKEQASKLTVGDTTDRGNYMGPVVDENAYKKIQQYLAIGQQEGRLVLGGSALDRAGYFIEPTIIADVKPGARIEQEEIFGPVLAVIKAKDFDDALAIANDTEFGLTGALISTDRERIARAERDFHVGNLYINRKCTGALVGVHPFGGFNMSGTDSKAGGSDYLMLFVQAKSVAEKIG